MNVVTDTCEWVNKPDDVPTYDDAFWVRKERFGTFVSVAKDGTELITSLHESLCIDATRFYLRFKQEN
jgi:hypothetical protein